MRAELALSMAMLLAWSSAAPDVPRGLQQPEPTKGEKQVTPTPEAKQSEVQNTKPMAACGFCLEDGTKVPLTLGRELSSGKESTGNRVDFEVSEDIKVGDALVIPKGSMAVGTITEAQARRRLGRAGKLDVRIEEVRLTDGSRARLRAMQENKGKGRQGMMTVGIIGAGILFFPAAPVFLFMRGKDIVIAKGTPVISYIDGNTELDAVKFGLAGSSGERAATTIQPSKAPAAQAVPNVPAAESSAPPTGEDVPSMSPTAPLAAVPPQPR